MDYFVGFGLVRGSAFFRRLGEGFAGLTLVGVQRLGAVLVRVDFEQGISKIRAGGSLPVNHSASTRASLPVDPSSNYKLPMPCVKIFGLLDRRQIRNRRCHLRYGEEWYRLQARSA
jgi:hypothetical protein